MCIHFGNRLLIFLIVFSIAVECSRKYDINDEAHKLYQTDLYSVLQKFRRTPEYQKILEEKKEENMAFVFEAFTQILFRYKMKLKARLVENFEIDKLQQAVAASQGSTPPKSCFRMGLNFRKNDDQEPDKDPGIARLDQYNKFYGKLTLTQRNRMKDLGFEYAGHVIHALIKAMGPDNDHMMKSTLQPYDDDEDDKKKKKTERTTTEHAEVHKVTQTTEKIEEIPIETAKPEKRAQDEDDENQTSKQPTRKEKKTSKEPTVTEPTQVY